MTSGEAARIVTLLFTAFQPRLRLTPAAIADSADAYRHAIADLDAGAALEAVRGLIATESWLPSIRDIRDATVAVTAGEVRAGGEAWGDILRAVSKYGIYRDPKFDDPVVAEVVDAMGWREICNSENQAADRARCIELYDRLAATRRRGVTRSPGLAGGSSRSQRLGAPERQATSLGDALISTLRGIGGDRGDE